MMAGLERVMRRVAMIVGIGKIETGYEGAVAQKFQVNLGNGAEIRDNTVRLAEYGFTSFPLPGANAVVMFVSGDRSNGVIVGTDDPRYRLRLVPGEVALYTDEGDFIHFKRGREIDIIAGTKVRLVTPRLECTGDIIDNCDTAAGATMESMRQIYNDHQHTPTGAVPIQQMPE